MSGEAWLFLFAVLINAVNLFLQVFFTIMYSDLEWYVAEAPCPDKRTVFAVILAPRRPRSPSLEIAADTKCLSQ